MADLKVVEFRQEGNKANTDTVISMLNDALSLAKENGAQSLVILMTGANGNLLDGYHNGGQPFMVLGALEAIKTDFLLGCIEGRNYG